MVHYSVEAYSVLWHFPFCIDGKNCFFFLISESCSSTASILISGYHTQESTFCRNQFISPQERFFSTFLFLSLRNGFLIIVKTDLGKIEHKNTDDRWSVSMSNVRMRKHKNVLRLVVLINYLEIIGINMKILVV